jgi:2-oxo-3-(phosphooxy)propyl 3-oxoalkanoate synthase
MTVMINTRHELPAAVPSGERLFKKPVSPRLVRRTNESDVFVTDLRVTGYDTFEVSARLPGSHQFYGPSAGLHDPLLLLESVREAILLVGHVAYEIPREFKFITHDKQFSFLPDGLHTDGDNPVDLLITLTCLDIRRRGRRPAGMRTEVTVHRDGTQIGTATYRWSCVSAAVYAKLRGEYRSAVPAVREDAVPVRPELVGRTREVDVLLAEAAEGSELRVDPAHEVLYDHVIDHVPGNGVVEAIRQAALLTAEKPAALAIAGDISFAYYIEFDEPCLVTAEPAGAGVRVVLDQHARTAATGVITLHV